MPRRYDTLAPARPSGAPNPLDSRGGPHVRDSPARRRRRALRMEQRDPAAPGGGARRHARPRHARRRGRLLHARVHEPGHGRARTREGPPPHGSDRRRGLPRSASWSSTSSRSRRRPSGGRTSARAAGSCRRPTSPTRSSRSGTSRTAHSRGCARTRARVWPCCSRRFPVSSGPRWTSPAATPPCRPGRTAGTWTSSS